MCNNLMWRKFYAFMLDHPGVGRKAMWWFLRKSGLLKAFGEEGYLIVKLLGATGERFAHLRRFLGGRM